MRAAVYARAAYLFLSIQPPPRFVNNGAKIGLNIYIYRLKSKNNAKTAVTLLYTPQVLM